MFGSLLYDAFRRIKRTFDPAGILNPGKIVDAPPLTANLRYGTAYRTSRPETFFDYSEYGGLAGAVEMCSGLGVCRKTLDGTMCPSYMATREEAHSTRGRANVLRLAMSGRLKEAGLDDEGVRQVLDLCLECRACKSECPVGVDVARFKSEFLADFQARHGTRLRARVLGHVHEIARWGSLFAPASNWLARAAPVRWLNETLLGLDRRRVPPQWASRTFAARFAARQSAGGHATARTWESEPERQRQFALEVGPRRNWNDVLLFNDTFTNYYQPEVGFAAIDVLEATGLRVRLAPNQCCGRPLISQGLLDAARDRASRNTDLLHPHVRSGDRIVFLEPSCLSAMREDVPALLRGEAQQRARQVADSCVLFEDLVERQCTETATLSLRAGPARVLLHGHCHQKAMGLVPPAAALLSRIPGTTVVTLDAGCCGMAGSFGYGREHFEVSRSIGERKLLPAARSLEPDGVLVASGVSCRQQVSDFTRIQPLHPAQLLSGLMKPPPV
jgi:Fe-S oxidoreductase